MIQARGTIKKIKVLATFPRLLVRFSIETNNKTIHCISAKSDICHKILLIPENTNDVAVYGHFNSHNQIVVEKFFCNVSPISYFQIGA